MNHHQVAAVFIDVRKAFDSVPHDQLISSFTQTGITGPLLHWISNYLSERGQRVVLDGVTSTVAPITSGVLQGSILSPLLFNIFMNCISEVSLSNNAKIVLYADDILIYKPVDSMTNVEHLQEDVNKVINWTTSHCLPGTQPLKNSTATHHSLKMHAVFLSTSQSTTILSLQVIRSGTLESKSPQTLAGLTISELHVRLPSAT